VLYLEDTLVICQGETITGARPPGPLLAAARAGLPREGRAACGSGVR